MLKHATINRTSRAQQTLQLKRHWNQNQHNDSNNLDEHDGPRRSEASLTSPTTTIDHFNSLSRNLQDVNNNATNSGSYFTPSPSPFISGTPSPTPSSLLSTPSKLQLNPAHSLLNSPTASPVRRQLALSAPPTVKQQLCSSSSIVKIFAQTLSQDVEYVTLHVNTQTKSNQIIRSLLRKFRLKHRDPNLFYLTLERWIRVDGLKVKSVMLLADEHCPLQLQQCCSNPPHNDIKFTLQIRSGALVKIFCSDVAPETKYKCLSLSSHTTVEESMELMLHCLNLTGSTANNSSQTTISHHHQPRQSGSPSSTGSSASSNSSSSGIESDHPNCLQNTNSRSSTDHHHHQHLLDSSSRTSSVTSISSVSNLSNLSSSITDQYCLVIECNNIKHRRILEADEYIVEVYENLLAEAKKQSINTADRKDVDVTSETGSNLLDNSKQQIEKWFCFKLKRRADHIKDQANESFVENMGTIKFANPRHNLPLPPLPLIIDQVNNDSQELQRIVSMTQIEVNCRSTGSSAVTNSDERRSPASATQTQSRLPPQYILLPPIRPRRRNLSNASSTFCRPTTDVSKRRYDPAQLAADINKLDVKDTEFEPQPEPRTVMFDATKHIASLPVASIITNDSPTTTENTLTS